MPGGASSWQASSACVLNEALRRLPDSASTLIGVASLMMSCRSWELGLGTKARTLPPPHAAHIHMNEIGTRVIADPAGLHVEGRAMERLEGAIGDADIDRLALHMQAVGRHALALAMQHRIGLGRAIARDDEKRRPRVE